MLEKITKEFVTSLITIILAIFAIAIFISSGGTILFYVSISIAIVFGFLNVWLVSKTVSNGAAKIAPKNRKGKRK